MASQVNLSPEDPTIFAKCENCCKRGRGVKIGDIFLKAFTERRWKRDPECENCGSLLTALYRIE